MEELIIDYKKEVKKNNLLGFVRITLSFILAIVFILTKVLFAVGVVFLFLTVFFLLSFIFTKMMNKEIYLKCSKEKKIEFDKYELSHRKFVDACKKGIPDDTYIKVNDKVYSICAQKTGYYINFKKFKKLDEFLDYKFDGEYYLNNLKKVTFLQVSGGDAKSYFEDKE